jgi:hypothetical protein
VGEVDKALLFLRARYQSGAGALDWSALVHETFAATEVTLQIAVIDRLAALIASNIDRQPVKPINLGDREHFKVHAAGGEDRLFISKPVVGRASGKWSVQMTRRFNAPDGTFGGVIVASLDPLHLSRFYDSIKLGPGGVIALVGLDGVVRATGGAGGLELGRDISSAKLMTRIRQMPEGSLMDTSESC